MATYNKITLRYLTAAIFSQISRKSVGFCWICPLQGMGSKGLNSKPISNDVLMLISILIDNNNRPIQSEEAKPIFYSTVVHKVL